MALTSPALTLSVEALFGNIKPALDIIQLLGPTDFSAEAPGVDIKPGTTIKIPLSTVSAAGVFDDETNNYLTGGNTEWATLTAKHYLQGFDLKGTNIDEGVNAPRVKQLFSKRCGTGISMACVGAIKTALDATTVSTAVTLPAAPTLEQYDALASAKDWYNGRDSVLCLSSSEYSRLKGVFHALHLSATPQAMAEELGFKAVLLIPGLTARAVIVPYGSLGFQARVPTLIADYKEAGVETDPDSGLSVGIVVASEQRTNKLVVNGDIWFGCAAVSASADAEKTKGIIKVGTAA